MIPGLVIDSFAGGGGASTGIEAALGRPVDYAINHDAEALAMHAANHPATMHLSKNVWQIDPLELVGRRPVALAWFSPDCKHFSKAKGGRPVRRAVRDLAWVAVLWARRARPAVIMLENVEEFRDWGPLVEKDGAWVPCPDRKGEIFARWVAELRRLGYRVEWRCLRACDYGAPTIRRRLFLIARRDGLPIVWPAPTHADPRAIAAGQPDVAGLKPYRTAAGIIDWSLPCPSIFLTREEGRARGVKRPLAEATMRRIARGVVRYVLDAAEPFVVPVTHHGDDRVHGAAEPLRTVTAAHRGEFALIAPYFAGVGGRAGQSPERPVNAPYHTMTAKADTVLVAPSLIQSGYGERAGQAPRSLDVHEPLGTVVAGGAKHALVAAFLAQHNTDMVGHDARAPLSTIVGKGCTQAVVSAGLLNLKGADRRDGPVSAPAFTQTSGGNHQAEIRAFLVKYYGAGIGQGCGDPLHTAPTRDRFGLVTVEIAGEPWVIADIGMRMLTPRELFRAQGFPDSYIIDPVIDGRKLTKTAQIRMCGNSVCPPVAEALVRANIAAAAAPATESEA
jgi:DNA (cytosine-5)-methyltransferase 1